MKYFNIPGIQSHFILNTWFLNLINKYPQIIYPDTKISSVYGCFQYSIWNGGRVFSKYRQITYEEILSIKEAYDKLQLPIRFTFTNSLIEEKHLYDRFCNLQLKLFHDDKNEIVINSPLLEEYIRINYPKYKLISSTTKRITDPNKLITELENPNYYQVCLDYDLNKNMDLINSIPKELRNKCEFLINESCYPNCPSRVQHYFNMNKGTLSYLKTDVSPITNCSLIYDMNHPERLGKGNNFTFEEINNYNKLGYNYFKIEGRTFPSFIVLLNYLYYLIKPEWRAEVLIEAKNNYNGIIINSPND